MEIRSHEEWLKELHETNQEILQEYLERARERRKKLEEKLEELDREYLERSKEDVIRVLREDGVEYLLNDPEIKRWLEK